MTTSPTYGPVDYLITDIRYTTLEQVKLAMGVTDTSLDAQATQSIVTFETMIDVYLGRSFPDTGDNPDIDGIPVVVQQAALVGSMRIWKTLDSPGGTGGSDAEGFIGLYEPEAVARTAFNSIKPMLGGLKTQWGVA